MSQYLILLLGFERDLMNVLFFLVVSETVNTVLEL